ISNHTFGSRLLAVVAWIGPRQKPTRKRREPKVLRVWGPYLIPISWKRSRQRKIQSDAALKFHWLAILKIWFEMPLPDRIGGSAHESGISADLADTLNRAILANDHIHNRAALNMLLSGRIRKHRLNPSDQILFSSLLWKHERLGGIDTSLCTGSRNRYLAFRSACCSGR